MRGWIRCDITCATVARKAGGEPERSNSASAEPSRAISVSDRKRSRLRSLNFSILRQGLRPSGRRPHFSARVSIAEAKGESAIRRNRRLG
jgi:hypothetical protein